MKETNDVTDYYSNEGSTFGNGNTAPVAEPIAQTQPTEVKAEPVAQVTDSELNALRDAPTIEEAAPVTQEPKSVETQQVAEDYDIEVDEDSPLTDEDINDIVSIAEDKGLTKEQAQKLINQKESIYKRGMEAKLNEAKGILAKLEKQVKSDPLFATPEAVADSFALIDLVVNKFGNESLKAKTRDYLKRDIDVLKFLHRVGSVLREDTVRGSNTVSRVEDNSEGVTLKSQYPEFF